MVRITDTQLLELLEENARMPASHMAERLGVTETAVRKRIRKLEENGIITHYTIRPDPKKSSYTIVFIGIDAKPETHRRVAERVIQDESVKRAYTTSGDHHLQLECWFTSTDERSEFLKRLEDDNEITKVCPGHVHEQIK